MFPDWYTQLEPGLYTHLFSGLTVNSSVYKTIHPDWKMERRGFLGPTTRRNILQSRYKRHFGFTGSNHIVYSMSPYQIRDPFQALRSIFGRHEGPGVSYFIRVKILVQGQPSFWVQTNSYNYIDGPIVELVPLIILSLTSDSVFLGTRMVEKIQAVVRL
jgi:hypothetical protein